MADCRSIPRPGPPPLSLVHPAPDPRGSAQGPVAAGLLLREGTPGSAHAGRGGPDVALLISFLFFEQTQPLVQSWPFCCRLQGPVGRWCPGALENPCDAAASAAPVLALTLRTVPSPPGAPGGCGCQAGSQQREGGCK